MYSIYADDICIYDDTSPLESLRVISPNLVMEDSAAGSLEMTIPPTNPGYDYIVRMDTDILVKRHNTEIWAGRVLSEDEDFWNNRILICEGELSFLNDTTQPPNEYHDMTVRGFLSALIDIHNSKVAANRKFTVGVVTVTDPNDSLYRYTNYEKTIECINEKLINRLGGHLRVRKVNGVRYLDYLADSPNTNSQTIEFGKNLMDFTRNWDMTEYATVIVPLGARLEGAANNDIDAYLTVESVNDSSIYVQSTEAVKQHGWIEKVVNWDDVTVASNLLSKAKLYLSDTQFDNMTIELSALDMHYYDVSYEAVNLLDKIKIVSRPHGMDRYFMLTKLEIPLDSPENTAFTLGDNIKTSLTSVDNATSAKILQNIENLPKASAILKEAKENATAIMKMATNGYITVTQDENGSNELYVSDNIDYKKATRYWLLNMNGFGYSGDGGKTFGLALTMDGAIVADYITVGTLNGELLKAGSVKTEAISQEFKTSISNDIGTAKTQIEQAFKAADGALESRIKKTYATKNELSSSITQTIEDITTEVKKKIGASEFSTYLKQNYKSFLFGFNGASKTVQIGTDGIGLYDGSVSTSTKRVLLNGNGLNMWKSGTKIGKIGTNHIKNYPSYKGLVFDLDWNGDYITWAYAATRNAEYYTNALTLARVGAGHSKFGLYIGCSVYAGGNTIDSANLTNVKTEGKATFTGKKKVVTNVKLNAKGGLDVTFTTYTIKSGMLCK